MKKLFFITCFLLLFFNGLLAQPGRNGALTVSSPSTVVNKYWPVSADIAAGAATVSLAMGSNTVSNLCPGDLIMVYQAQGASMNTVNLSGYGAVSAYNSAGLYEFNYVQSVSGNVISTQLSFTNSYVAAGRVQVIKVPQYTTLTINSGARVVAKEWKDTTIGSGTYRFGGLVVVHALNIINNGTITARGAGFRGGVQPTNSLANQGITSYVASSISDGGEKGEGISGFKVDYDVNGGRYARGAPANGGGGGNAHNSGGGGGANGDNGNTWDGTGVMIVDAFNPLTAWALDPDYIANGNTLTNSSGGGRGGYSWGFVNSNATVSGPGNFVWGGDSRSNVGGLGGRPLTNINAETRIYFGGGGGAGNANNNASKAGGDGGGIVYLVATGGITGSGLIQSVGVRGGSTFTCSCDGASGGGAGGSIVVKTPGLALTQTLNASGGDGGDQLFIYPIFGNVYASTPDESDGPGGGGGGGFTAISSGANVPIVTGGINGQSLSPAVTEMPFNGATKGATGQTGTVSTAFISFTPIYTVTSNAPVCAGSALQFTSSPATFYTWSGPAGFSSSIQNPTIVPTTTLMSGTYSVFLDFATCAAPMTQTINIVINPLPVISVSSVSICPGTVATLTSSGAQTYTWNPGNITGSTYTATPAGVITVTITGSANSCTDSTTATISIHPLPSFSFNAASITCAGLGSATISPGNAPGPFSYTWMPTAQTTSVANNLHPGTYTLSISDANTGCTFTSTTTFSPLVAFNGTVSATASLPCNGISSGTAVIALSGGSGAQSYTWSNPAGVQTSSVASLLPAGIHTVVVTDSLTYCTVTETFQINQPLPITVSVTASASLACINNSITLSANSWGGAAGYSYGWAGGPASAVCLVSQNTGGSYVYTVNVTDANNCVASASIALEFINPPVLNINSPGVCPGADGTFSVSGATSYTWYPGLTNGATLTTSPPATAAYTVVGETLGCQSSTTAVMTIYLPPGASISGSNIACEGTPISLNAGGSGSYAWNTPGGASVSGTNLTLPAAVINDGGVYSLLVTSANSCTSSASIQVTVLPKPVLSASGASVCAGGNATLNASGGVSYSWAGPNGYNVFVPSPVITNVTSSQGGVYSLLGWGVNTCMNSQTVMLSVLPYSLPNTAVSGSGNVCLNSNLKLTGSGGVSYTWTGPGNLNLNGPQLNFMVTDPAAGGIYTLSVKNESNCAASTTVAVTVHPLPRGMISSSNNKQCVPLCSDFTFVEGANTAPVVKTWFLIPNQYASDADFTYCIPQAGNHKVQVTFTDTNGCANTSTVMITAYPKPEADFEFAPRIPLEGVEPVYFTNTSTGDNLVRYDWFFTDKNGGTSHKPNASYVYENAGAYPVVLVVSNNWGCADTVIKVVKVGNDFAIYVPNAFSPNGDGLNDVFQPKGVGITGYRLEVFDRWGEKLFESSDFFAGWDGMYKGKACKQDSYQWKIAVTDASGKNKQLQGYVNIIY